MIVTRLEHPRTGCGPFTFLHNRACYPDAAGTPDINIGYGRMPGIGVEFPDHYKFGFSTAGQANVWWDREARRSAAVHGFKLAVYDVPEEHVIKGDSQVAFDPRVAKLLSHIDPERWVTGDLNMILQAELEQCELTTAGTSPAQQNLTTPVLPASSVQPFSLVKQRTDSAGKHTDVRRLMLNDMALYFG